jgi:hypothetical protein
LVLLDPCYSWLCLHVVLRRASRQGILDEDWMQAVTKLGRQRDERLTEIDHAFGCRCFEEANGACASDSKSLGGDAGAAIIDKQQGHEARKPVRWLRARRDFAGRRCPIAAAI